MKKQILTSIAALFLTIASVNNSNAQSAPKTTTEQKYQVKGASTAATPESLTKTAIKTGETFTGQDGEHFTIWKSSKGSLFIVRKSKKGNWYKTYLESK